MSRAAPHFRLAASGSVGCVQIDVPRDAFLDFEAPPDRRVWTYQTAAFLHGMKALPHAHETYLRVNDRGMLLVQHMVANTLGNNQDNMYLEYLCCAEGDDYDCDGGGDDGGDASDAGAGERVPFASPAF